MIDYASQPINTKMSAEEKVAIFRQMARVRYFETLSNKPYIENKIGGFLHLYAGQEACAIGSISVCGENDHIITAYRCHGHALACGMDMQTCMAELYGKKTGCSKGKGGSMHFFDAKKRFWGGHGIVGGQTPLGLGLAFAQKYKNIAGSCLCYLGDGAVNQGAFHESLNLAQLLQIPVIYIIENNKYSMGTSQQRSSAYKDNLAQRAESYGMAWDIVDQGMDVYAVRHHIEQALQRAHNDSLPTLIEVSTYRYYGHSIADANAKTYRTPEEIEQHQKLNDPLNRWSTQIISEKVATQEQLDQIVKDAKKEVMQAISFAEKSEFDTVESIFADVYYEVDHQTIAGKTGRHFFND